MLFISKSIFGLLREWAKPTNCPNYIWHWLETLSIHRLNEEKCIQLLCAFENFFRQRRRIGNTKSAWEAALLMLATNICIKPAKRFLHFLYHKCQYSRKSPCTNSTTLGLKGLFLVNPYFFFFLRNIKRQAATQYMKLHRITLRNKYKNSLTRHTAQKTPFKPL